VSQSLATMHSGGVPVDDELIADVVLIVPVDVADPPPVEVEPEEVVLPLSEQPTATSDASATPAIVQSLPEPFMSYPLG
jgi:hypothetical protein